MLSLKDIVKSYRGHYSYYRHRPDEDFGAGPLNPVLSFINAVDDAFCDVIDGKICSFYHYYDPDWMKEDRGRVTSHDSVEAKRESSAQIAPTRALHILRNMRESASVKQPEVPARDDYRLLRGRIDEYIEEDVSFGLEPDKEEIARLAGYYCGVKELGPDVLTRALKDAGIDGEESRRAALQEYGIGRRDAEQMEIDAKEGVTETVSQGKGIKR